MPGPESRTATRTALGRDRSVLIDKLRASISIEMRDYGSSFDPTTVPPPDFDALPEHGWGLFIIRSFMNISYAAGRPNVLTLTKTLDPQPPDEVPAADPTEGAP